MLAWLTPDELPIAGDTICRPLRIPNDQRIIAAVNGAILTLTESANWEAFGNVTPEDIAYRLLEMFEDYATSECSEGSAMFPLGVPFPYITADPPAGCIACDGDTYLDTDYPAIWAILDPAWQVDGTHWIAPDMRGRAPIGAAAGYDQADTGGEHTHQLSIAEMPNHAHTLYPTGSYGSSNGRGQAGYYVANLVTATTSYVGGGGYHNNDMPWQAFKWAIRVE